MLFPSTSSASSVLHRAGHLSAAHRSLLALVAACVGVVVGAAAELFNLLISAWTWVMTGYWEYTSHVGEAHGRWPLPWWVFLLLAPVISAAFYGPLIARFAPSAKGHGIPEVMLAVQRNGGYIPARVAVVKLVSSALTIGGGGSAGREGPIVQVGASLGSSLATALKLPTHRVVMLAACGAAGGVAATFHAPLAGAFFALEVILTQFTAEAFGYVVVSSVMASLVARAFQGNHPLVDLGLSLDLGTLPDIGWVALLGLFAGLCGLFFSKFLYFLEDVIDAVWARFPIPVWARAAVLSVLLGVGLVCFPAMYGSGYPIQLQALQGRDSIAFLLLLLAGRILYTSYTIGIGGSGGVFAPTLFIGAMAGCAFGQLIAPLTGSDAALFGVIGMGAAFAGAARAPMTAVLIIVEMTGQYSLILPMMLAVVIATFTSRYLTRATIYTEKLRRRGDVLDEPVDHTLLGRRPASALMSPPPAFLTDQMSVEHVIALFRRLSVQALPVIPVSDRGAEAPRYLGTVSALDVAAWVEDGVPMEALIGELGFASPQVEREALPSEVLRALLATSLPGIAVVSASPLRTSDEAPDASAVTNRPLFLGWVTQHDLVSRIHRDQRRAVAAGQTSSWGSRWQQRHRRD